MASLLGPRVYSLLLSLFGWANDYQGKIDSWWLHMAMIRQDHQRKGVLRALVDMVRKKVGLQIEITDAKTHQTHHKLPQAEDAGEYLATCTTNDDNVFFSRSNQRLTLTNRPSRFASTQV